MVTSRARLVSGTDSKLFDLARTIIQSTSRKTPADKALRETLENQRNLTRKQSARVSQMVFAYYRWLGWLEQRTALPRQIEAALDLSSRFEKRPETFSDSELIERSVPAWLGNEMPVTPDWARALQRKPKLWLRARRGRGAKLASRLGSSRTFGKGRLGDILEYKGDSDLYRTAEFQRGEFEIQDISSQAVGLICEPRPGETWWDACAGEGGKTLHLSDLMENKGSIWATDHTAWRLQKLKRRAARAAVFNYRTAPWNGGSALPTKTRFDGVLLDAPCTGVGTWQRNPHARWTVTLQDVAELSALQTQLLVNASAAVKTVGKLIYAVCTLTKAETISVAEAFEKQVSGFKRLELPDPLSGKVDPSWPLLFWPQQYGGNGMFIAAWSKLGERQEPLSTMS